jgi:hypothetical protein
MSPVCTALPASAIAAGLPKPIAEFLLAMIHQFGWPPATITIQDSEFAQAKAAALLGAPAAVTTAP